MYHYLTAEVHLYLQNIVSQRQDAGTGVSSCPSENLFYELLQIWVEVIFRMNSMVFSAFRFRLPPFIYCPSNLPLDFVDI